MQFHAINKLTGEILDKPYHIFIDAVGNVYEFNVYHKGDGQLTKVNNKYKIIKGVRK